MIERSTGGQSDRPTKDKSVERSKLDQQAERDFSSFQAGIRKEDINPTGVIFSEAKERPVEQAEGESERQIYKKHMEFEAPEKDLWTKDTLEKEFRKMGVTEVKLTEKDSNLINDCYGGKYRSYHTKKHANFVANSGDVLAGAGHDVGYKHVDASPDGSNAWPEPIVELIGDVAKYRVTTDENGKKLFTTYLTDAGKQDPVTQMVAGIFDVSEEGITQGSDEFDSALAIVKLMQRVDKKGEIDPREFIAKTAKIAGTIPFQKAVERDEEGIIVGDGHMRELAHKVKDAQLTYGGKTAQLTWDETNAVMRETVKMANCDIAAFTRPGGAAFFIDGGRKVKKEEVKVLREKVTNMEELVQVGELQSATLLYNWVANETGPISANNVPHIYFDRDEQGKIIPGKESYPPKWVYEKAKDYSKENCEEGDDFSNSHRAGIDLVASIATKVGEPNPPVPGFVYGKKWDDQAVPQDRKDSTLSEVVHEELINGTHQTDIDPSIPRVTRVGGFLYSVLGREGVRELSIYLDQVRNENQKVKNPFANPEIAERYYKKVNEAIGEENMRVLLTELHRVAVHFQNDPIRGNKERPGKLKALAGGKLLDYSNS